MRIGFFGGCFNPPTNAHVNLAKKALIECNLDKVIFVPVGDFYNKKELVTAKHRYNMLKLVCKDLENIEVSDIETKIEKNIYAVDAFKLIENNYPDVEIFFILGADNFINLINWKDASKIIEKYNYIILDRENIDIDKYINESEILSKYKKHIKIIRNDEYKECSSTKFRNEFKKERIYNQDIIPDIVLDYIIDNNIFQ